jgi:hypothetical protein
MKRNVIAILIAAGAIFAFACGGTAPNANNSNLNKNTAILAPNANMTPAVVPNNTTAAPVNGNKTAAPTGVNSNRPGPARPVDEKLKIMREEGKTAANASAPRDTVPPPATPKKP